MKILKPLIAAVLILVYLAFSTFAQDIDEDNSLEEDLDSEESSEKEEDDTVKAKPAAVTGTGTLSQAEQAALIQTQYEALAASALGTPYITDPWLFYKWPGVGQSEGVYARWPWWPGQVQPDKLLVQDEEKKKKKEEDEAQEDEDEDEEQDDEPEDDFSHHHDDDDSEEFHHHKKSKKRQKPTAAYSVGVGPAEGKLTWYGVLKPEVNARSDLDLDLDLAGSGEEWEGNDHENSVEEEPLEWYYQPVSRRYFNQNQWDW